MTADCNQTADAVGIGCSAWLEPRTNDSRKEKLHELHLFAGGGGGILGGILLGHEPVCAVEIEKYQTQILLQRQRDGILPRFPIWDDVRTFDGRPWNGITDIVCGGFPCQDISAANQKANGLDGERSGLWREMSRIIGEIRPRFAFVENSPMLVVRGLDRVLGDLTEMGYSSAWGVFSGADFGARHIRERLWILAHSDESIHLQFQPSERQNNGFRPHHATNGKRLRNDSHDVGNAEQDSPLSGWWKTEPGLARLVNGVANQMDRLETTGNGQIPIVAAGAWRILEAQLSGSNHRPSRRFSRSPS